MVVDTQFLGKPRVLIDGVKIDLPQRKPQALLLYVLFHGECTREELAELLWCDYPEADARRNLRNCLYKLKVLYGQDILSAKGHSFIKVHPEITVSKDINLFITENSTQKLLELESCVFLDRFNLKSCPEFESWIVSIRGIYEKMMIKRFETELARNVNRHADLHTEQCAVRILSIDPYHEESCRQLMRVYSARQDYNGATLCFQSLQRRLEEELGVTPEPETKRVYQEVLTAKISEHVDHHEEFDGYNLNISSILRQEYRKFCVGNRATHSILSGDIGMGKSVFLHDFAKEVPRTEKIHIEFNMSMHHIPYYATEKLLDQLSALIGIPQKNEADPLPHYVDPLYHCKRFERILARIEKLSYRIVIFMQNLEAVDRESIALFVSYLLESPPVFVLVVGEHCPNFECDFHFESKLRNVQYCNVLSFESLNCQDSMAYMREYVNSKYITDDILQRGYEYTGGNLLLLKEFSKSINLDGDSTGALSSDGLQMIGKLLSSLNAMEHQFLEVLSILKRGEIASISHVLRQSPSTVIEIIDQLIRKGWIQEQRENDHILLCSKFGLIQDMLLARMMDYKKIEFYSLAAEYYEVQYLDHPLDLFYLTQVKNHYKETYAAEKKIYYGVLHLEFILDYYDEFFPTIADEAQYEQSLLISRQEIYSYFDQYHSDLIALEDKLPRAQWLELKMKLDFLQGRAKIRDGHRNIGRKYIENVIQMAIDTKRDDILMKSYVEMLCYSVRSEDTSLMKRYIQLAQSIDNFKAYEKDNGVLLRLQGYLCILQSNHQQAEEFLYASVQVFEQPKLRSTNYFNLAGAYAYLSLNNRRQHKLDKALEMIHCAIDLCVEKNVQKSLDVFYEDLGYILFLQGNYDEAEQYFLKSIQLYEEFDTYWLRSVAESGLAMIYAHAQKRTQSIEHFRQAEVYSRKEMANEELVVLAQAKSLLKMVGIL